MLKKALLPLAVAVGVMLAPAAAWADHCANLSRGAGNAVPWETVRGRWSYIAPDVGPIWVFATPDNFHNGRSDGLLDGSGACNGLAQTMLISTWSTGPKVVPHGRGRAWCARVSLATPAPLASPTSACAS